VLGTGVSREQPRCGDDDRVLGDDAERYADNVKDCLSAAVARRDSSNSPLGDNLSSCTPTVHPERYVGSEYAIAAVILVDVVRNDKEIGGHAVCDLREYSSCGARKEGEANPKSSSV
jgi:hypothetical protein